MRTSALALEVLENSIIERSQAAVAAGMFDVGTGLTVFAENQEPGWSSDCCSSNNY